MRITAAAAEGRANTVGKKCGKQSWEDTIGLESQLWSSEEREPLVSMNRKGMRQVTLEAHPDGQKGGRMAKLAFTNIRFSTLQGFQERVVHLTLGQTRQLLGGMVAPAGACSSHRNQRREREGDVRCPLHLKRLGDVTRPLRES